MNSKSHFGRKLLALFLAIIAAPLALADGMPPVPADYPSHVTVGECNRETVRQRLQEYNETRLAIAEVLRDMAKDQKLKDMSRQQLLGYADGFDQMRRDLPAPDPDSNEFRNFDFQLGIRITAMTLFLNSADENLAHRFTTDRDNPNSELGTYLARLEKSRLDYTQGLAASKVSDCQG